MEKSRVIRTNSKVLNRAAAREGVRVAGYVKYSIALFMILVGLGLINFVSYNSLLKQATANQVLQEQLTSLKNENSNLEGIKAKLLNIRDIEKRATELGFVYNKSVKYINKSN